MIKLIRTLYRNYVTYPVHQKVVCNRDVLEAIVYTYVGDRLVHISEVRVFGTDFSDRYDDVMDRDWRSAKVFRDIVYRV